MMGAMTFEEKLWRLAKLLKGLTEPPHSLALLLMAGREKDSVTLYPPLTPCSSSRSLSGQSSRSFSIIKALDWRGGTYMSHTMRKHKTLISSQALKAHHRLPTDSEPK